MLISSERVFAQELSIGLKAGYQFTNYQNIGNYNYNISGWLAFPLSKRSTLVLEPGFEKHQLQNHTKEEILTLPVLYERELGKNWSILFGPVVSMPLLSVSDSAAIADGPPDVLARLKAVNISAVAGLHYRLIYFLDVGIRYKRSIRSFGLLENQSSLNQPNTIQICLRFKLAI